MLHDPEGLVERLRTRAMWTEEFSPAMCDLLDQAADAIETLSRQSAPMGEEMVEKVAAAAREYASEHDEDNWCQRVKYGKCALRKCNVEGGWKPGSPCDYSLATCARYRLEAALSVLTDEGEG